MKPARQYNPRHARWAEVEFAYTSGYDSRGRLSVNHIVDERDYGAMFSNPERRTA